MASLRMIVFLVLGIAAIATAYPYGLGEDRFHGQELGQGEHDQTIGRIGQTYGRNDREGFGRGLTQGVIDDEKHGQSENIRGHGEPVESGRGFIGRRRHHHGDYREHGY